MIWKHLAHRELKEVRDQDMIVFGEMSFPERRHSRHRCLEVGAHLLKEYRERQEWPKQRNNR